MKRNEKREPNFENLRKVLRRETPDRPTLFEFYIDNDISEKLTGMKAQSAWDCSWNYEMIIPAMQRAGYDYATMHGSSFGFPVERAHGQTVSMSKGVIEDRETFERYPFQDPDRSDYSRLARAEKLLPPGMKIIVFGPGGVLENVISLVGYENLCYLLFDNEKLVEDIFEAVGGRLIRYYENCLKYDCVGAVISNDDWGFNTGTMLSTEDMRKYVFPYHKKIVELAHKSGRPAILHSCGNLEKVMDDLIDDMNYDGKHSYEDKILPVEDAYRRYGERIAILGGVDLDFVCQSTPEEVRNRCESLVKTTKCKGYALGTGNSIPNYVPPENFRAIIRAVYPEFTFFAET